MQLCEFANESIAILDYQLDGLFALKGNRIIGFLGKLYDDLLVKPEKRRLVRTDFQISVKLETKTLNVQMLFRSFQPVRKSATKFDLHRSSGNSRAGLSVHLLEGRW